MYSYELQFRRPGPFEVEPTLYLDDNGTRAVNLSIRGVAVADGGPNHEPPKP